jgi:VIT1/CCC1 family predicted Fe2+/Mn2+ transporter
MLIDEIMAHSEHNKQRSGGFFLIIFGALLFVIAPAFLGDSPELGITAIIAGFLIGGLGFYINFVRGRKKT